MSDYKLSAVLELRDNLTNRIKSATQGLRNAESTARSASGSIDSTAAAMARAGTSATRLQQNLRGLKGNYRPTVSLRDEATGRLDRVKQELRSLTNKAYTATVNIRQSGALGRLRGSLSEMASGAMMGLPMQLAGAAGIGYGIYDTINTYRNFEQQMSAVGAIRGLDSSSAAMQALTEKATELGATTAFTATQAGKAFEYMAMAGWDTSQMLGGVEGIMSLAAASGEDLGRVSDIVTDSMTAFGMQADQAGHFADVLAVAASNSNTNVGMMGETFKYVAPLAGALKFSIEDVALATGMMANAGIKGEQAGTSLRYTLTQLIKMPKDAAEALDEMGVSIKNDNGSMRSLRSILKDLRKGFSQMTDAEKAENAEKIAGVNAMSGFLAMMNESEENWEKIIKAIDTADGAAKEMERRRLDNLSGDITLLGSAWEAFQNSIMQGKGGEGLREFLQGATKDINVFRDAIKDGFDISDIGKVAANILKQLKDKFLELNGVGSLLAGGALVAGLYKIVSLSKRAVSAVRELTAGTGAGRVGTRGSAPTPTVPSGSMSVGSMTVRAASVVINGKVAAGGSARAGAGAGAGVDLGVPGVDVGTGRRVGGRNIGRARGTGRVAGGRAGSRAAVGTAAAHMGTLAVGGVLAGVVGAMDMYATHEGNKERTQESSTWLREANDHLKEAASALEELRNNPEASEEEIAMLEAAVKAAEAEVKKQEEYQKDVEKLNSKEMAESTGGAIGGVVGSVLGGVIGSMAGPVGAEIGTVVGGYLGQVVGTKAGELATEEPAKLLKEIGPTVQDEFGNDVAVPGAAAKLSGEVSAAQEHLQELREEAASAATSATQALVDEMQADVDNVDEFIRQTGANISATSSEASNSIQNDFKTAAQANSEAISAMRDESVSASSEVKSAWSGIGAWIASLFSFGGSGSVAHNASGTSYFGGGWTEINEHGGEIVDLPSGSRIYPYATTMGMLENLLGGSDNGSFGGGGGGVAHNASGTSYFGGGWTEINEHGGEIVDLPDGSRIYPHATTMEMLEDLFGKSDDGINASIEPTINVIRQTEAIIRPTGSETSNNIQEDFKAAAKANSEAIGLMKDENISAFNEIRNVWNGIGTRIASLFSFDDGISSGESAAQNVSGTPYFGGGWTEINGQDSGQAAVSPVVNIRDDRGNAPVNPTINISGNTFNVREDADIDKIAYKLMQLIQQTNGNYNYVGA